MWENQVSPTWNGSLTCVLMRINVERPSLTAPWEWKGGGWTCILSLGLKAVLSDADKTIQMLKMQMLCWVLNKTLKLPLFHPPALPIFCPHSFDGVMFNKQKNKNKVQRQKKKSKSITYHPLLVALHFRNNGHTGIYCGIMDTTYPLCICTLQLLMFKL